MKPKEIREKWVELAKEIQEDFYSREFCLENKIDFIETKVDLVIGAMSNLLAYLEENGKR